MCDELKFHREGERVRCMHIYISHNTYTNMMLNLLIKLYVKALTQTRAANTMSIAKAVNGVRNKVGTSGCTVKYE